MIFQLLGGIGLFLLGMVLLTDGLKASAGNALRRGLTRFTGTPARAFASGTLVTLMVQSSSATTVTLIGFVSAGLLAFPQAVGVVMGASLGTTGTGWLVSVLGLKVNLGFYALPLVGIGALLRLVGRGRVRPLGMALAGFGLIFVGIETLQEAMRFVAGAFDLGRLPSAGPVGHLTAMGIGVLLTVVLQSSSAAVATTLTALHAGAVNFEQAATLVIGAAVGTTVTGALAALGGSTPAKRTALAHVLFNLATGIIAVVLLPLLLRVLQQTGLEAGAVSLAAFHTLFIAVGVAVFLPFASLLARGIERILPDRGPRLTRHLDSSLLQAPPVAVEAARRSLVEVSVGAIELLAPVLEGVRAPGREALRGELDEGFAGIQRFIARIPSAVDDEPLSRSRVAQLHAIDHLSRLLPRVVPPEGLQGEIHRPELALAREHCREVLRLARNGLRGEERGNWLDEAEGHSRALAALRRTTRLDVLEQTAGGARTPSEALASMDAIRWLERVGHHLSRASRYLATDEVGTDDGPPEG